MKTYIDTWIMIIFCMTITMGFLYYCCNHCKCIKIPSHTRPTSRVIPIASTTVPVIVNATPIAPTRPVIHRVNTTRPVTPTVPTITPRLNNNIITLEPSINTSDIELPIAIIIHIYQTRNGEVC